LQENALFGDHDRYRLIRLLGHGGYSEVWLAEDRQAGLTIALKVYAPGRGLDEDGVTQFSKEFKMVFNLNHANLLRPTHYDVFERMPYLIMPYCEHGSSIKLSGKINEKMAWTFLHDVASGLAYLHAQERAVIHQDIKPDNVLMDSSDSFVITDFGISAKVRNTLQSSGSKAGTMTYMAPERFDTDYQPIKASDVWALGASLFELMTGKPPFGENGGLAQKGGAEVIISGNWSPKLKEMVFKCLQKKTWDRPTAKAISEEAKRYLHEDLIIKKPVRKKFPKVLALAGMILFGLGAGFFAGSYLNKTESVPEPKLQECILLIEQGDAVFDENNLSTWRESLTKYQEAKQLIDQYSLQLPNMERRIRELREKMDDMTHLSVENAKKALAVQSEMALFALQDALEIDPDNEEAKALYEQYLKLFPRRE
jgi:serine/threonine protein kinase